MNRSAGFLLNFAFCILHFACFAQAQQPAPAAPAPVPRDPVARELLATSPTTPSNMLRVINALVDLHEGRAAGPLLQRLNDTPLDDAALYDLFQEHGSSVFLKIAQQPELTPLGKQFADKVLTATNKYARSPERISALIEQLRSPSPAARAAAVVQLGLGGDAAARALLTILDDPARAVEHPAVEAALVALDAQALGAVAEAAQKSDSPSALRAIAVLGRMPTPDAELFLYAPAFAEGYSAEMRQAARRALAMRGADRSLDASQAAARLYFRALEEFQHQRDPGRLLAAARQILPNNAEIRRLDLTVGVELGAKLAGAPRSLENESNAVVEDLLADALARNRWMTAIIAAKRLGASADAELVRNRAPDRSVLIEATRHADRRIRFAAVEAIMQLGAQQPYPGDSDVLAAMDFCMRSTGARRAIIADVREQHARNVAGLLISAGYEAEIANDELRLLELATTMPDCELVLIHMNLVVPSAGVVVARLRQDARTAWLPIGILATSENLTRAEAIAERHPRTLAFVDAPIEAAAARAVAQLDPLSAGEHLTAAERLTQAQQTFAWLATADDAQWTIDQWRSLEPAILPAVYLPALGARAIAVLPRLGTAASQRTLLQVAGNDTQPLAQRQAAVAAFGDSVQRFGTLLTSAEIAQQYDRYNASQRQPKAVQDLLAAVLDQIEARRAIDNVLPLPAGGATP
ncbi:MAG TPA: hypothetical protein VHZ24_22200 [Pirellulales bacterium]|jgi:hypothetical protein|nr:hypothetical protein [Pirellulales bacterium]